VGVTVVVPTVDRVALLERCLQALAAQAVPAEQVVVVHDGDPGVRALLLAWTGRLPLLALQISERGASAKRNAGWRAAQHELVAFTDDDCAPTPDWVGALAAADGDLLCGPVAPHPADAGVASVFGRTIEVDLPGPYYPTANLAVRRSALAAAGGFDEALRAGEDTDLAWRLLESGAVRTWVPAALVHHAVRPVTFPQHLRSLWRWSDLPLVLRRHPALRQTLTARVFWKPSHPTALAALIGALLAPRRPRAALLAVPLLASRWRARGPRFGTQVAVADTVEVAVVLAGSVRHRSLLL
jgi:glycosyltransferase involved in cell wall biosynthesis